MTIREQAIKQLVEAMPGFEVNNQEFQAFENWNYLAFFLLHAMNAVNLAKKYNEDKSLDSYNQVMISNSLFRDSIMSYCKCFASAEAKRVKLDIKAVLKDIDANGRFSKLHEKILHVRNKYVAHNLENDFETSLVASKVEKDKIIVKTSLTILTPSNNEFDEYFEMYALVSNYIILKVNNIADRIEKEKGIRITFE